VTLSERADALRQALVGALRRDPARPTIGPLLDEAAALVVLALEDEGHGLSGSVNELTALRHRRGQGPEVYFAPKPGTSVGALRPFWPTQLLLLVAANVPQTRQPLAKRLGISAARLVSAARRGGATVEEWGPALWTARLIECIGLLRDEAAPEKVRLHGSKLTFGSVRRRLSPQERAMYELLRSAAGAAVMPKVFAQHGIRHPRRVKSLLARKLEGLPVDVRAVLPGGYALVQR
jgi:hypothetical protein